MRQPAALALPLSVVALALGGLALTLSLTDDGEAMPRQVVPRETPSDEPPRLAPHADLEARLSAIEARLEAPRPAGASPTGATLTEEQAEMLAALEEVWSPRLAEHLGAQGGAGDDGPDHRERLLERLRRDAEAMGVDPDTLLADFLAARDTDGSIETRMAALRRFAETHPGTYYALRTWVDLGILQQFDDQHDAAIASYHRVIDANDDVADEDGTPVRARALFRLGGLLVEQGRLAEARALAAELKEDFPDVRHPLGSNTYARMLELTIRVAERKGE